MELESEKRRLCYEGAEGSGEIVNEEVAMEVVNEEVGSGEIVNQEEVAVEVVSEEVGSGEFANQVAVEVVNEEVGSGEIVNQEEVAVEVVDAVHVPRVISQGRVSAHPKTLQDNCAKKVIY